MHAPRPRHLPVPPGPAVWNSWPREGGRGTTHYGPPPPLGAGKYFVNSAFARRDCSRIPRPKFFPAGTTAWKLALAWVGALGEGPRKTQSKIPAEEDTAVTRKVTLYDVLSNPPPVGRCPLFVAASGHCVHIHSDGRRAKSAVSVGKLRETSGMNRTVEMAAGFRQSFG
eukprot:gene15717-biopygen21733